MALRTYQCLVHHLPPDDPQDGEDDPVVDGLDIFVERPAHHPAEDRHEEMEPSEPQAYDDHVPDGHVPLLGTFADRYDEAIHRHPDGQHDDGIDVHTLRNTTRYIETDREPAAVIENYYIDVWESVSDLKEATDMGFFDKFKKKKDAKADSSESEACKTCETKDCDSCDQKTE